MSLIKNVIFDIGEMFFQQKTQSFVQLISLQTPSLAIGFMINDQERLARMLIHVRKIVKLLGLFQNAAVSVGVNS